MTIAEAASRRGTQPADPARGVLSASGLHHAYGATTVLRGVNFRVEPR